MKAIILSKIINKKNDEYFIFKYFDIFLYLIAYIFYYLSLEKCLEGEELCGNNMTWIYKKLVELIISCEIISFLIGKMIFNYSSKLHLMHLFLIFSLFILYSHDFFFWNHGMYNLIFFVLLFFLNICIILFFKFIICLIRNKIKILYIDKSENHKFFLIICLL